MKKYESKATEYVNICSPLLKNAVLIGVGKAQLVQNRSRWEDYNNNG